MKRASAEQIRSPTSGQCVDNCQGEEECGFLPAKPLANLLLEEAGVAVLPGSAFGQHGEGYLRLCYANTMDNIREAVQRIGETLGRLQR